MNSTYELECNRMLNEISCVSPKDFSVESCLCPANEPDMASFVMVKKQGFQHLVTTSSVVPQVLWEPHLLHNPWPCNVSEPLRWKRL